MKKAIIISLTLVIIFTFLNSCTGRQAKVQLPPPLPEPTTPPTPQEKEQPPIEKVEVPETPEKQTVVVEEKKKEGVKEEPLIKEYKLTEEEIFRMKSLEEINREAPLKRIHFDYDEYYIREDAKPTLEANAAWLREHPTVKILIEGHCDERGTEEYNLALGERRASSTRDYLVSLGISAERITIISYGKSQPLDPGHNEVSWQKNRRAEFLIIGK
ncbi:MAG: peptidoglycan-associated lipoprotein Pal [Candidatus Aminicenantales bacterium]